MVFRERLVIKPARSPGELVVPLRVFLEFVEVVHIDLVRQLSETCAAVVICSHRKRFGEDGVS
jgi:hypothetical protein